jgi:peptide/nickel transport system permease protein
VLPVFCLTYGGLAGLSRYARAGMLDVIRQDYIRTARAYGFSEKVIIFKYAMRNAMIPIITLLATLLPGLLGGSVIVESIFSIPGMGRLGFEAVLARDYPVVMGLLAISALLTLIGLILSDILYALVDPRIKFE